MTGKELIDFIESPNYEKIKGHNIMGCAECYYDPKYLIYRAFYDKNKLDELRKMENLDNLFIVADFATDVFY